MSAIRVLSALLLATSVSGSPPALAHDGQAQEAKHQPVAAMARARWIAPQRLHVPKPVQRLLGLRTRLVPASGEVTLRVRARVLADAGSAVRIQAGEAGRIEVAQAWPLPGAQVAAGEVLAVLRPLPSAREQARRRVSLAQLEQRLAIARVNVDRLRVQVAGEDGRVAQGNIYYEQAESELLGLEQAHRATLEALDGRREIRAPTGGQLYEVAVEPGQVVDTGANLFAIVDAGPRRLEIQHFQHALPARLRSAVLLVDDTERALKWLGQDSLEQVPGWRLWLGVAAGSGLVPGSWVDVRLALEPAPQDCVEAASRETWVHIAPEVFERRAALSCIEPDVLRPDDREVVQGGALLSAYPQEP